MSNWVYVGTEPVYWLTKEDREHLHGFAKEIRCWAESARGRTQISGNSTEDIVNFAQFAVKRCVEMMRHPAPATPKGSQRKQLAILAKVLKTLEPKLKADIYRWLPDEWQIHGELHGIPVESDPSIFFSLLESAVESAQSSISPRSHQNPLQEELAELFIYPFFMADQSCKKLAGPLPIKQSDSSLAARIIIRSLDLFDSDDDVDVGGILRGAVRHWNSVISAASAT